MKQNVVNNADNVVNNTDNVVVGTGAGPDYIVIGEPTGVIDLIGTPTDVITVIGQGEHRWR